MVVSEALRYVYIGIPRTASKSMHRWLIDNFQGEWFGYHHRWQVPEEFRDYLIFTVVRNPYEREVSSWFNFLDEPPSPKRFVEKMRYLPSQKDGIKVRFEQHNVPEVRMNQKYYVERANVSLVLHHERLPDCLLELPFVDNIAPFPRLNQSERPAGNFFDHFTTEGEMEGEEIVWEYACEDFEAFGYRRFDCGLPDTYASEGLFFK